VKIEIKHWWSGKILLSVEAEAVKIAVELAVKNGADLKGACLTGADLKGACLTGADLKGACLTGAYLTGAYLTGADLTGADLTGADLKGADLTGADLTGADLTGADLKGGKLDNGELIDDNERPFFAMGPIGSDQRTLFAFSTKQGIRLRTGCFFGSIEEFVAKLKTTHGENNHSKEYLAALSMIKAHFDLWKKSK